VEDAQLEGSIASKQEAMGLVKSLIAQSSSRES
jgi:hypothetical protein